MTTIALVALPLLSGWLGGSASQVVPSLCARPDEPVHVERFVAIGGTQQWVTIDGERCGNPIVLFVHGGPGNPLTPVADALYGAWASEFTLVHWDQRGAGRTYGRQPPSEDTPLTLKQMTDDGIELAEYLTAALGQPRLVLTGTSWGSILGVHMVQARPKLFAGYVGLAQFVTYERNLSASYEAVLAAARSAKDDEAVSTLEGMGPPPWRNPRGFGVLRRATRRIEGRTADPAPEAWWIWAADYDTPQDHEAYSGGEDYSYIQFVGLQGDGMASLVDLPALGTDFEVPVSFVQGAADLVTVPTLAREYFDAIEAPRKQFVLVPRAGHDQNPQILRAHLDALRWTVLRGQ